MVVAGDARSRNVLSPRQNVLSSVIYTYIYLYTIICFSLRVRHVWDFVYSFFLLLNLTVVVLENDLSCCLFSCKVAVQIAQPFFFFSR